MKTPLKTPPVLSLTDYTYALPDERIAQFPLPERDASKLLVYKNGEIVHSNFQHLSHFIPNESTLFFNNTKVIPARLYFQKDTGAQIEIFLLAPLAPHSLVAQAMQQKGYAIWKCMIGNLKRWKEGQVLERHFELPTQNFSKNENASASFSESYKKEKPQALTVRATLEDRQKGTVRLEWNQDLYFAEMVELLGKIPLPPYIKRESQDQDQNRYQTIYSKQEGAVAAPTAGLHFTERVFSDLAEKKVQIQELTLHVSAGTFQPIASEDQHNVAQHAMHSEQILLTRANVEAILSAKFITAVGTTSMRTLESAYWYGVMLLEDPESPFFVPKLIAYQHKDTDISLESAFQAILAHLNRHQSDTLMGETEIFILPSYDFKVCDALITNFHQPETTLMLLVAAFVGEDWREIYQQALDHQYRFLSYGDSSLLFRK
ncbi:S-adenosylmethionine:tRNA ribosyltransferase-isomerase [Hugenholtzia roseola]|uniref:S-adenosylmethionine:tRNA ribosyltransferase-isomerase n=1 Tax=Hugenholtzia roseola TaxID=1002 RepID=UPI0003F8ECA0|nr:S-adenosylmethionine:tRNA ribosyltransferase-isomerase [Hugenholtzia roseola]